MMRYWCSGTDMSADLKRTVARVRAARPELFAGRSIKETSMDGEGRVTESARKDVKAVAMSGGARHALSLATEYH